MANYGRKDLRYVNNGVFLGADFNSIEMMMAVTGELVIAIDSMGVWHAAQDNRHGVDDNRGIKLDRLDGLEKHEFFADVSLVNERYGILGKWTYEVKPPNVVEVNWSGEGDQRSGV